MINVSTIPTIIPGSHRLKCVEQNLETLAKSKTNRKGCLQPCRALEYEDLLEGVFIGLKKGKS